MLPFFCFALRFEKRRIEWTNYIICCGIVCPEMKRKPLRPDVGFKQEEDSEAIGAGACWFVYIVLFFSACVRLFHFTNSSSKKKKKSQRHSNKKKNKVIFQEPFGKGS